MRLIALTLIALVVSSTAVAEGLKGYKGPDGGWIVVSVTIAVEPNNSRVEISFAKDGDRVRDKVVSIPFALLAPKRDHLEDMFDDRTRALAELPADYVREGAATEVLVLRVPPGSYEFSTVTLWATDGFWQFGSEYQLRPTELVVTPGKAIYAGALTAAPFFGANRLGQRMLTRWVVVQDDESARDVPLAIKKTPGLSLEDFQAYRPVPYVVPQTK